MTAPSERATFTDDPGGSGSPAIREGVEPIALPPAWVGEVGRTELQPDRRSLWAFHLLLQGNDGIIYQSQAEVRT